MSRIAEAYARAGRRLPVEDADRWEIEREFAARHLADVPSGKLHVTSVTPELPTPQSPIPDPQSPIPAPIDFDLASAIRKIFVSPKAAVHSVFRRLTR